MDPAAAGRCSPGASDGRGSTPDEAIGRDGRGETRWLLTTRRLHHAHDAAATDDPRRHFAQGQHEKQLQRRFHGQQVRCPEEHPRAADVLDTPLAPARRADRAVAHADVDREARGPLGVVRHVALPVRDRGVIGSASCTVRSRTNQSAVRRDGRRNVFIGIRGYAPKSRVGITPVTQWSHNGVRAHPARPHPAGGHSDANKRHGDTSPARPRGPPPVECPRGSGL